MRLTYSRVYSYWKKNIILLVRTLRIISKKLILQLFVRYSFILVRIVSKCFDIILTVFSSDYWDQRNTAETSDTFDANPPKMNEQAKVGKLWAW